MEEEPKEIEYIANDNHYFVDPDDWAIQIKDNQRIVWASSRERAEYFIGILNGR